MTKSNDTEEIIKKEIHDTLKRSKKLSEQNPKSAVTSEHFHSYEYLSSLFSRRQALSNQKFEWLTIWIIVLTIAVIVLATIQLFK